MIYFMTMLLTELLSSTTAVVLAYPIRSRRQASLESTTCRSSWR